jgi:hypothetical protein
MSKHLTEIQLEMARTGEGDAAEKAHLEQCAACQERLDFLNALAANLKESTPAMEIPRDRDAAIVAMIRHRARGIAESKQTDRARSSLHRALRWAVPIAAAASLALLVAWPHLSRDASVQPTAFQVAAGPDDINGDGTVDILDAFALARSMKSSRAATKRSEADIERIAMIAVALDSGRGR